MKYGLLGLFNKTWVAIRCTALLLLLIAGAVRAFAFSHPVEVEVHIEASEIKGTSEYERANREAFERVNEGNYNDGDLERALDYVHERLALVGGLNRSTCSSFSVQDMVLEKAFLKVIYGKSYSPDNLIMARKWVEKFFPRALSAWDWDYWQSRD